MTTSSSDVLRAEQIGAVSHLVMHLPPANALGLPLISALEAAVDAFLASDAKVLVISSAVPGFFAAGADLKLISTLDADGFSEYVLAIRGPMDRLAACGRPSIAAIDGFALGGGLELAMACTLRLATRRSRLGLPEVKLGLVPGAGGTQRLPPLVGAGRALKIMLSGDAVDGVTAAGMGLVDQLVADDEDVVAEALRFATRLGRWPAEAMASIIACVEATIRRPAEGMDFEIDEVSRLYRDGVAGPGIAAFLAKTADRD